MSVIEFGLSRIVGFLSCVTRRSEEFVRIVEERDSLQSALNMSLEVLDAATGVLELERELRVEVEKQLEQSWGLLREIHRAMEGALAQEMERAETQATRSAYMGMTLESRLRVIKGMRLPADVLLPVVKLFEATEPEMKGKDHVEEGEKEGEEDLEEGGEGRPWPHR